MDTDTPEGQRWGVMERTGEVESMSGVVEREEVSLQAAMVESMRGQPLVTDRIPLLGQGLQEWEGVPQLQIKMLQLAQLYPALRKVRGDGNCFLRAFVVGMLENLILRRNDYVNQFLFNSVQDSLATVINAGDVHGGGPNLPPLMTH